jgi:hypothetical protein
MKVKTWVDIQQQVEVDVTLDDIRAALAESFAAVTKRSDLELFTKDTSSVKGPNRYDVMSALNCVGAFLNALTDEHIGMLRPAAKTTVANFLAKAARRFE